MSPFFLRLSACIFCLVWFTGCSKIKDAFSEAHVKCISYDGSIMIHADGSGKNEASGYAALTFDGPGNFHISTYTYPNKTKYFDSIEYDNAEVIADDEKGVKLTLQSNKLVGLAEIWKDNKGSNVSYVQFPVVCFKFKKQSWF